MSRRPARHRSRWRGILTALAQGLVVADRLHARAGERGGRAARLVARALDDRPATVGTAAGASRL